MRVSLVRSINQTVVPAQAGTHTPQCS